MLVTLAALAVTVVAFVALYLTLTPAMAQQPDNPRSFAAAGIQELIAGNAAAIARGDVAAVSFHTALRGYDRQQVDDFVAAAATGPVAPPQFAVTRGGYRMDQVDDAVDVFLSQSAAKETKKGLQ